MTDLLRSLLQTPSGLLADVDPEPDEERLLVRSDLTGTMQLYELRSGGPLRQVTSLPDPVGDAAYLPGRRMAVIGTDRGGDERHQLALVGLERAGGLAAGPDELDRLTDDPRFGHHLAGVSPDGRMVAYTSNRANGVDFDLWVCDLDSREHRLVRSTGGWSHPGGGFSPDGRWVALQVPGPHPLDTELLLVEVATGRVVPVLPHPDEPAAVGPALWLDADTLVVSSDRGRDRAAVYTVDVDSGTARLLLEDTWELSAVAVAPGRLVAVVANVDGSSRLSLLHPDRPGQAHRVPLEGPGVVAAHNVPAPRLSPDGSLLYFTLSTPRRPAEVLGYRPATGRLTPLTDVGVTGPHPERLVLPEAAQVTSFDGERIPLRLYRPGDAGGLPPVVVLVHGGPESQSTVAFNPIVQALAGAGFAVVVPNVRGSTGYGRRYASLDDTVRRLDSVADLAAIHAWLGGAGLDPSRAALWGGSYGGYMVLAGLAFQPECWAAGVDIVGISDLVTFLEHTSPYRRAHREREYGSLATDRDFLASASPLRRAEDIRAPLFMIHGRNDPRVPVGEAEQLAARLHARGVPCELVVYDDEGHGLARLDNRLDAYPRAVAFLEQVLRPGGR